MSKVSKSAYNPDYVSPPGETLQETLAMLGLSQAELAERTGRPKKTINEIVQGKAAITPETALQLELVLRIPASFWLVRESKYRAWLARQVEDARLEKDTGFLERLPLKEMAAHGWIAKSKDKRVQVKEACSFFGVVSSDKIPLVEEAAFRRSDAFATNAWALAAWLRKGELDAQEIQCKHYDPDLFIRTLPLIRALTTKEPSDFVGELTKLCANAGVAVVFVQELPKTSVSGATRWLSHNRPLIQLSLRHKTDDMIWFAFFHESGHVYHAHAKREVLLEDRFDETLDHREVAANRFAMDMLIPAADFETFLRRDDLSKDAIRKFAKAQGIAPGIVLGRLQYEKKLDWKQFRDMKRTFSWESWPAHK
jgi:HTH-type transcriptional regulator / antitoxin HigA